MMEHKRRSIYRVGMSSEKTDPYGYCNHIVGIIMRFFDIKQGQIFK